eukprot:357937-Chlamydomonas_euryale.AAC.3
METYTAYTCALAPTHLRPYTSLPHLMQGLNSCILLALLSSSLAKVCSRHTEPQSRNINAAPSLGSAGAPSPGRAGCRARLLGPHQGVHTPP